MERKNHLPCEYTSRGCTRLQFAKGMCKPCYEKNRRGIEPMTGRMRGKTGARVTASSGYILVYDPQHPMATGGYVLEHRMVMSEILGRSLLKEETVHHRNGDRSDNRPDNLELWSKAQPAGQAVSDKVQFALEILGTYAPELLQQERQEISYEYLLPSD